MARRDQICSFADDVLQHPEFGFRETRTAKRSADELRVLGFAPREDVAVTGVIARVRGGSPGPTVAVMGELDALPCPDTHTPIRSPGPHMRADTTHNWPTCSPSLTDWRAHA